MKDSDQGPQHGDEDTPPTLPARPRPEDADLAPTLQVGKQAGPRPNMPDIDFDIGHTQVVEEGTLVTAPVAARAGSGGAPEQPAGVIGGGGKQVVAGRFEVLELLGKGGMGEVYRVRDKQIPDRKVALKVLNSRYSKRKGSKEQFFREIRAAQAFVNEHINQVRDTGQTEDGRLYLTMDLVEGESLRDLLKRENSLHERHALEIARQVLLGLQSGHENGLIHRDVKPENIMLEARTPKTDSNPYGVAVRLLDFGLAGLEEELSEGGIAGTPVYMSPEQARGQRLDARSDLFAVGVVLYEMISGTRPFHGKTVENIITSVIQTDVAPLIENLSHLSKPVQKLLNKALEKKREDRVQSAANFIEAIEHSAAYVAPRGLPLWAMAAMALLTIGVLVLGVQWKRASELQGELDGVQNELASVQGRHTTAMDALRQQLTSAQDQLEAERAKTAQIDTSKVEEKSESGDRLVELGAEVAALRKEVDRTNAEFARAERERDFEKQERLAKEQRVQDLQDELRRLGDVQAREAARKDPIARAAFGTERLLKRLESGYGTKALAAFYSMAEEEVFQAEDLPGAEFLEAFTSAGAALSQYKLADNDSDRAQALRAAEKNMERAHALRPEFEPLAAEWIGQAAEGGGPPDRLGRIDALLAGFQDQLDSATLLDQNAHAESWAALAGRDPVEISGAALQHERDNECEHTAEFLAQYAAALPTRAHRSGKLDVLRLEAAGALAEWSVYIAQHPALRKTPDGRTVLLYGYAQRWFDDDDTNDELDWSVTSLANLSQLSKTDAPDWAVDLRLRYALVQPNSPFPGVPGRTAVFRTVRRDGSVTWEIEELEGAPSVSAGQGSWTVALDLRNDQGNQIGAKQKKVVERFGSSFGFAGSATPLFDLRREKGISLAHFQNGFEGGLPPQLPPTAQAVAEYRTQLAGTDVRCLEIESESVRLWISPLYGCVREQTFDATGATIKTKELVFASRIR